MRVNNNMKASVQWVSDELFLGTSESGHVTLMDGNNGNLAPSPLENILISLGGCASVDVVSILQKAKQNVKNCQVEIEASRVNTIPRIFSTIHLTFIVTGNEINEKHLNRAVTLSAEKYCSVAKMLEGKVTISHSYKIKNL
jgi:putative redox protein